MMSSHIKEKQSVRVSLSPPMGSLQIQEEQQEELRLQPNNDDDTSSSSCSRNISPILGRELNSIRDADTGTNLLSIQNQQQQDEDDEEMIMNYVVRMNSSSSDTTNTSVLSLLVSEQEQYINNNNNNNSNEGEDKKDIIIDPRYILPKCIVPVSIPIHEMESIELFVSNAIREHHLQYTTATTNTSSSSNNTTSNIQILQVPVSPNYKVIIDTIRLKKDLQMIYKLFIALRTSNSTIHLLSSSSSSSSSSASSSSSSNTSMITKQSQHHHHQQPHARLIHHIVRFIPFPPTTVITTATTTSLNIHHDSSNKMEQQQQQIYDFSQVQCDTSIADAQFHFYMALVSANTIYVLPIITALWKLLVLVEATTTSTITQYIIASHPIRTTRVHAAIATITRLCPKAKMELLPIIVQNVPYRNKPILELLYYYTQCLTVIDYVPHLRNSIIELILRRCLEVDVEIQITDYGEAIIDNDKANNTKNDDDDDDGIFQLDMEVTDVIVTKSNPIMQVQEHESITTTTLTTVDETADKLDLLLLLLFEYVEKILGGSANHNNEDTHNMNNTGSSSTITTSTTAAYDEIFHILLHIFESSILNTHKSKFVQFVVLHICGIQAMAVQKTTSTTIPSIENIHLDTFTPMDSNESKNYNTTKDCDGVLLYREFASHLIHTIVDPYKVTITRQSAACYLASFVSRANYVCVETICESIDVLLRWAEAYIQSLLSSSSHITIHAPDIRDQCSMHSLFYTVCQAAFYIMCFRGVEVVRYMLSSSNLSSDDNQFIDLGMPRWTSLCSHPLLPLRYCLESVRTEFLRISKLFTLIDHDVLHRLMNDDFVVAPNDTQSSTRRKKKVPTMISTPATLEKERVRGGVGGLGRGTNPLDSFFPFDPYLLRRSHYYIEPYYNHWDGGLAADIYVQDLNDNEQKDENDDENTAIVADGDSDDGEEESKLVSAENNDSDDDDDDENEDSSKSDSDEDDDDDNDEGVEDVNTSDGPINRNEIQRRKRIMSFASNATSISSSRPSSLEDNHSHGVQYHNSMTQTTTPKNRIELKKAWSMITKRPRAPSCSENGSW